MMKLVRVVKKDWRLKESPKVTKRMEKGNSIFQVVL